MVGVINRSTQGEWHMNRKSENVGDVIPSQETPKIVS